MTVETDPQTVHRAVLVLEDALEQKYPGESLDPEALAVVLARLTELQAMERRVGVCVDRVYGDNAANRDVPGEARTHSAQTIIYGASLVGYIRHGGELSEWFKADRAVT
jgi:hypothetical protein